MSLKTSLTGILFAILCMSGSGIWAASALNSKVEELDSKVQLLTEVQSMLTKTVIKTEITEQRVLRIERDLAEIKADVKDILKVANEAR